MTKQHTPGPWNVGTGLDDGTHLSRGEYIVFPLPEDEEVEANARLIAAAPALLELAREAAEDAAIVADLLLAPGKVTPEEMVNLITSLGRKARAAIIKAGEGCYVAKPDYLLRRKALTGCFGSP